MNHAPENREHGHSVSPGHGGRTLASKDSHTGHPMSEQPTHGQATPAGHAHSAVDDEHAVHSHGEHAGRDVQE